MSLHVVWQGASEVNSSGAIQRRLPFADVCVGKDDENSSRTEAKPKSAKTATPSVVTKILAYETGRFQLFVIGA